MTDLAAGLEATALAQHLKAARWSYPIANAGHILGIALVVGTVIPMGVGALRGRGAQVTFLRPYAMAGLGLAVLCGGLLFITQAADYLGNGWFLAKMALFALAVLNAGLVLVIRRGGLTPPAAAALSLALWPAILIAGRMIGYTM